MPVLLRAALGDDQEPVSWRVRQVDHRPGSRTTVAYDVTVRGRYGEHHQLVAASTGGDPGWGSVVVAGAPVTVWRFPLDPALPALATAVDEACVRTLLRSFGVPAGPLRLDVRSYRPGRRAVVEARAAGRRLFLKVVRPGDVEALHERHQMLRAAGVPAARSLGWAPHGLAVLEGLPGATLRDRLREGGSPAPGGAGLLALLDRLPREVCRLPVRRSWTDEVAHYAGITAAALPLDSDRCRQLAEEVTARTNDGPPDVPSHGDFYEMQLLLDGHRVSGLLDVDTVGPGRRADDLACLLAHVSVLAQMEPAHRETSNALVGRWLSVFERAVDPGDLRARIAGVIVSLATGPHRVQQRDWQDETRARLDLAERWLG